MATAPSFAAPSFKSGIQPEVGNAIIISRKVGEALANEIWSTNLTQSYWAREPRGCFAQSKPGNAGGVSLCLSAVSAPAKRF